VLDGDKLGVTDCVLKPHHWTLIWRSSQLEALRNPFIDYMPREEQTGWEYMAALKKKCCCRCIHKNRCPCTKPLFQWQTDSMRIAVQNTSEKLRGWEV